MNTFKIVIFDFEVFKYNTLLGAIVINDGEIELFQSWKLEEIKNFYKEHINDIWVGHNNERYDNFILQSIICNINPYITSKTIIDSDEFKYKKLGIHLYYFDIFLNHPGSLKAIECGNGKNISETNVDFDINRELTIEEKELTESYNFDDLEQTFENFLEIFEELKLRLLMIQEFNLDMTVLHCSETQCAEKVLKSTKIEGIENCYVAPKIYPDMQVKNQDVLNFYLKEKFRMENQSFIFDLCGVPHKLAKGGLHGAEKFCHVDWAYYFDVSGYYNLIMILKGLLPRTIPDEGKKLYEYMYHRQLELKITNPIMRPVYKTILLAVFGSMLNKWTQFYDPQRGTLVTILGQLYIIDLLEKLEGKIRLIQTNTDGVIAKPLNEKCEKEMIDIINEWQKRTGFTLKFDKIYDIHQRDVNNYMYRDEKGKINVHGELVKYYDSWEKVLQKDVFNTKEPPIIHHGVVEFYMNKKLPEQTVEENKNNLRMFQYCCRKNSFDWLEYEEINLENGEIKTIKLQHVNRAFAMKSDKCLGMIYKRKYVGKTTKAKAQNLPDSVFVYNHEILSKETVNKLVNEIDYDYYVKRIYERIKELIYIPIIKDLKI